MAEILTLNPSTDSAPLFAGIIGQRLSISQFTQLAGKLAGYPFVKVVVDRELSVIHFINNHRYPFHSDYIAAEILGVDPVSVDQKIDEFNQSVYHDPKRRF